MRPTDPALSALGADWLATCRRAATGVREALEPLTDTAGRSRQIGAGEGGDITMAIDQAAEDAIFAELESLDLPLTAISEERGTVPIAGGGPLLVVIDPIDGSLNAKRGLPLYAVSIAVAEGPTMGDVTFGYVIDLGREEEWCAVRGEGAFVDGLPLPALDPSAPLEMLGIESAQPRRVAAAAEALAATDASRVRALGSIALTMCAVAGARLDAMATLGPARSVDCAAAQLMIREVGGSVLFPDMAGDPLLTPLHLEMRSRVLAAAGPQLAAGIAEGFSAPARG